MKKIKGKTRLTLVSLISVFVLITLSRLSYIAYTLTSADVTFSKSENFLIHSLPVILRYASVIFTQAAYAAAVSAVILAAMYVSKKTSIIYAAVCSGLFLYGSALFFVYNLVRNSLKAAALIAGAMAQLAEVMYAVIIMLLAALLVVPFRRKAAKGMSHRKAQILCVITIFALSLALHLADLTAFSVMPFFAQYTDVTSKEIANIVFDYLYYIAVYFALPMLLSLAALPALDAAVPESEPERN